MKVKTYQAALAIKVLRSLVYTLADLVGLSLDDTTSWGKLQ